MYLKIVGKTPLKQKVSIVGNICNFGADAVGMFYSLGQNKLLLRLNNVCFGVS